MLDTTHRTPHRDYLTFVDFVLAPRIGGRLWRAQRAQLVLGQRSWNVRFRLGVILIRVLHVGGGKQEK